MQDPVSFYKAQLQKYRRQLSIAEKNLTVSSMLRLAIFLLTVLGAYLLWGETQWLVLLFLGTIPVFLWLVSRHSDLKYERNRLAALIGINETELEVQKHQFLHLQDGLRFAEASHYFSRDIDLFGRGSFFQYCNRTALDPGAEQLAGILIGNSIEHIDKKQAAVRELATMPNWRQHFSAVASLTKTATTNKAIIKWLEGYVPFAPTYMKYVPYVFSVVTIGLFMGYFLDLIPVSAIIIWWVLGLGITIGYSKKITELAGKASRVQGVFEQYNRMLSHIERHEFTSEILRMKRNDIMGEGEKTSKIIKRFSKLLYNLDKVGNLVYTIFGNGFFLRTLDHCRKTEAWIKNHGHHVEQWFDTVAFFDAYNSLGNFAFNHPTYAYPELTDRGAVLTTADAGHPLVPPGECVRNDFRINDGEFLIITGANMAGKSTFLRIVALQIVMANIGLPVCAREVSYSPIKLITSMRTTDSLTDHESYFFSELKRLKFIVGEMRNDRYFIVLDEILKGTNSKDKAEGSRKFIRKLVASRSTGIIATHDLSLCDLAEELPQVKNYYFDAEIKAGELHFDYRLKKGICQNMNASFLLERMGIVE